MSVARWFRRDAARKAGQASLSRTFTLGGIVTLTLLLGVVAALVALPFEQTRERQMITAAREQLPPLFQAVEAFRAEHYRFPDRVADLVASGYSTPPSIVVCRFRHVADVRNFDDHIEIALHHRGSDRAIVTRYPRGSTYVEDLAQACAEDVQ